MDPRHFQQSQTAWQQGSEHPAGLQLLPHPPYAPQPCFLSPLQQQHYGLMIPFPQQQTDLQQLLQHQQQQSQHFSQAHGSVPEGPWRAGRGRGGRGRGNHVVAALIATFAGQRREMQCAQAQALRCSGLRCIPWVLTAKQGTA